MAFLSKYRALRNDEGDMDEVEFNFGRAFHQLGRVQQNPCTQQVLYADIVLAGLHSLAVKHYERVLEIVSSRLEKDPDSAVRSPFLALQIFAYILLF